MTETTADFLLARLTDWGVRRLYGFPGDGINGLLGALDRAMDRFDYVQVRHEEEAAFMACAHAKFTGEPGVCLATSGPGAIHLLNGLYDAKADHQPVLAIVGQQARSEGMLTLRDYGWNRALAGVTSIEEVLRVTQAAEHPEAEPKEDF